MSRDTVKLYGYGVLGIVLLWGGSTGLQVARAEAPLELPSLIREALEHNPEIQAARQRWEGAKAVIPQVQTLPEPMITLRYEKVVDREWRYGVGQEFPFPGKLRLRGEVASREAAKVEQEYLAVPRRVIARLKEAFYDLTLVHTSTEIIHRSRGVLVDFERTAQARYAVGRGVQQDVFRAQTELSRLLARLAGLQQRQTSAQAEINRLLNRPPALPLGPPPRLERIVLPRPLADLNTLVSTAPLLQAQAQSVERGEQAIALARREFLPDFAIDIAGVRNETLRKDGYEVMLGIKVPLYYASKQRAGVQEALAGRAAALHELQAVRQELLFRLSDNLAQVQRAEQLMTLLHDAILPQARLTLESAQAGYAVGKVDFLTLLTSLFTLQENELELHGEITEHAKAIARIEEIIGSAP